MFELMPWKKRNDMLSLFRKETDDLFDRFFEGSLIKNDSFFSENLWNPRVDLSENDENIIVKAEIPGVDPKDMELLLDGNRLTLKGKKEHKKEEKGENYHRIESSYGAFHRVIELPAAVNESEVDASYKDGVLNVALKKTEAPKAKRIEVKTN